MKVFVGFFVFLLSLCSIALAHDATLLLQTYDAAVKTCRDYGGLPVEGTEDVILLVQALKGKTDPSQPGFVWLLSDHIYNWAHVYRVSEPHEVVSQAKTQEGWVVCRDDLNNITSKIIRDDQEIVPLTEGRNLILFKGLCSLGLLLIPLLLAVQFVYKFGTKVSETKQIYLKTYPRQTPQPNKPLWRKILGCISDES